MQIVAAIGGGAFVLASLLVSVRLLLLARRTRELPELLIGVGLLLMGAIGYPMVSAAAALGRAPELQVALYVLHADLNFFGQTAILLFTWRVFRPAAGWATALVAVFAVTMAAVLVWQTTGPGWAPYARTQTGPAASIPLWSLVALGWAGLESGLYHAKLRKRLGLGLADPVTADRLRLWAVSMLSAFTISLVASALRADGVAMTPTRMGILVGPLGLVAAGSMWLAFLPPTGYVRWIEARASTRA
jgi:hypothetical protein